MAPILTLTSDLWSTRGHRAEQVAGSGWQRYSLMILSYMQVWREANCYRKQHEIEVRSRRSDGNIAGSWTASAASR